MLLLPQHPGMTEADVDGFLDDVYTEVSGSVFQLT
jgi:hypothetical protein